LGLSGWWVLPNDESFKRIQVRFLDETIFLSDFTYLAVELQITKIPLIGTEPLTQNKNKNQSGYNYTNTT
jgi:hypothetical protein